MTTAKAYRVHVSLRYLGMCTLILLFDIYMVLVSHDMTVYQLIVHLWR